MTLNRHASAMGALVAVGVGVNAVAYDTTIDKIKELLYSDLGLVVCSSL
jgi:hypothetical protein